jgi:hypothetical protein
MTWRDWATDVPPRGTWVLARYDYGAELRVRTCKRGCCVWPEHGIGNMMLPDQWQPADPPVETVS